MTELIVVHGHPGSGKTSQSERLERQGFDDREVIHISIGDRLRQIRSGQAESEFANLINNPYTPSPLDDTVVNGVIFELLPTSPSNNLVLIDGYPRHESAVAGFEQTIEERHFRLLGCIALETSLETSLARVTHRGPRVGEKVRTTSLEQYTLQRYIEYDTQTTAAIAKLGEIAPVSYVDANANPAIVWRKFHSEVGKLAFSMVSPESK